MKKPAEAGEFVIGPPPRTRTRTKSSDYRSDVFTIKLEEETNGIFSIFSLSNESSHHNTVQSKLYFYFVIKIQIALVSNLLRIFHKSLILSVYKSTLDKQNYYSKQEVFHKLGIFFL